MANSFFPNVGRTFSKHVMPVMLDCSFVVDKANGNGLGIRSLKGPGILDVFMNTSSTPAAGNSGIVNPNPQAGTIVVKLADNYVRYLGGSTGVVSPVSGTQLAVNTTALTVGCAYIIVSLGTSTAADWLALGLPYGVTAAVGCSFIAKAIGSGSGSGKVECTGAGATSPAATPAGLFFEVVGDSNLSAPIGIGAVPGMQIIVQCFDTATQALKAPADGTVIGMQFLLANSSAKNGASQ